MEETYLTIQLDWPEYFPLFMVLGILMGYLVHSLLSDIWGSRNSIEKGWWSVNSANPQPWFTYIIQDKTGLVTHGYLIPKGRTGPHGEKLAEDTWYNDDDDEVFDVLLFRNFPKASVTSSHLGS